VVDAGGGARCWRARRANTPFIDAHSTRAELNAVTACLETRGVLGKNGTRELPRTLNRLLGKPGTAPKVWSRHLLWRCTG